ncbi:2-nitropropane dioxygenase [Mycobacterium malmoense]|uniref:NAD(P)H-dependent flavin oxidoreductase n=1 Tax=Mycobacterium malmoense TaxID=1780 RepID=UPI00080BC15D|nr:2-nitropropane dioxygenase [Mycobacterium malmoense]
MALSSAIRDRLTLPAVCAPMFLVSNPALVREACKAGLIGCLPRQNVRTLEQFNAWLSEIQEDLDRHRDAHPEARIGPLAVNLTTNMLHDETERHLDILDRYGVDIVISAAGNPAELIKRVHDRGAVVFADVTSVYFAEKAAKAGADGLICIGAGGGGHSGTVSHLALVPRVRKFFAGTVIMAGAISTGAAIRAAEILGADLAYLGTRFIATQESDVPSEYKRMLVHGNSANLRYTGAISGVPANWLAESIQSLDLDLDELAAPRGPMHHDHLPAHVKPWKNLWSAGQGIELITDIPSVAELVSRLRREYVEACMLPDMADTARLVDQALQ